MIADQRVNKREIQWKTDTYRIYRDNGTKKNVRFPSSLLNFNIEKNFSETIIDVKNRLVYNLHS